MTGTEFLKQFDILYNNISSTQAPGLTDEEIEIFLNQAQEELVINLYKGTVGDGFETTEEVTRYLSSLVKSKDYNSLKKENERVKITLDNDVLFIIYQSLVLKSNDKEELLIVPIKHDNLFNALNNPFLGKKARRVLATYEESDIIIHHDAEDIMKVCIKYLSIPDKIDVTKDKACSLPEILHNTIVLQAVQKAKAVWQM